MHAWWSAFGWHPFFAACNHFTCAARQDLLSSPLRKSANGSHDSIGAWVDCDNAKATTRSIQSDWDKGHCNLLCVMIDLIWFLGTRYRFSTSSRNLRNLLTQSAPPSLRPKLFTNQKGLKIDHNWNAGNETMLPQRQFRPKHDALVAIEPSMSPLNCWQHAMRQIRLAQAIK